MGYVMMFIDSFLNGNQKQGKGQAAGYKDMVDEMTITIPAMAPG